MIFSILLFKISKNENGIEIINNFDEKLTVVTNLDNTKNEIIAYFKNNQLFKINQTQVSVTFFDNKNKILATENMIIPNIDSNSSYLTSIVIPTNIKKRLKKIIINSKIEINDEQITNTYLYTNQIKTTYTVNSNIIDITIENNSNQIIDQAEFAVAFIKENKIIAIKTFYKNDLRAYETEKIEIPKGSKIWNKNHIINYDKIEIITNSAIKIEN